MKKRILPVILVLCGLQLTAQPPDIKTMEQNAKNFMYSGDYENAIVVLNRALQQDKDNLQLQKDITLAYYLKRDFTNGLTWAKQITGRDDADVECFQIGGDVYKGLQMTKDCEKLYKKALLKFPRSGPLYSEYGDLLWAEKDFTAIDAWEKGILADPSYSGNYYHAAIYYFYAKDKVWSIIYGEIYVNMDGMSDRAADMKYQLYTAYKEKLFAEADLMKGETKNKSAFEKSFLDCMNNQSSLAVNGITTESLTMIRTRFILEWFSKYANKFPYKLFDYQQQLIKEGLFDAYNQWLFGASENLATYNNWINTHPEEYNNFNNFIKNRIFKMPPGESYH
jgi:Tfp pilus assembly protein PilF